MSPKKAVTFLHENMIFNIKQKQTKPYLRIDKETQLLLITQSNQIN